MMLRLKRGCFLQPGFGPNIIELDRLHNIFDMKVFVFHQIDYTFITADGGTGKIRAVNKDDIAFHAVA